MEPYDMFDNISPLDYRYRDQETLRYLSENSFIRYKLKVELALVKTLHHRGICSENTVKEMEKACLRVTAAEVYQKEEKIKHDIRALVNSLRKKVSSRAKPYVHMLATSYDIIDTANTLRYKDLMNNVFIPALLNLEKALIDLTLRESGTIQIGRTHGQHAVPITFGFALAGYVSRLGNCIENLKNRTDDLRGKFSGAVGAYNATSLIFDDPEKFEEEILSELGLKPYEHSTQIVPPEPLTRLFSEVMITSGVLANLADDMRHLQRTEIGEVGEEFQETQVGSSTMPHKKNPINFENTKSLWKIIMPRLITVLMDQISEHQRDLTNSASARTYGEIFHYAIRMVKTLTRTVKKLKVDNKNIKRNLKLQKGLASAEMLYIILACIGHPDAHEKVRTLALATGKKKISLKEAIAHDQEIRPYLNRITEKQKQLLSNPEKYIGIADTKAQKIAKLWQQRLGV